MKICTITCQNAVNHGARLQACALLYYLNKQGYSAEVIDYRPDYLAFHEKIFFWPKSSLKEWLKLFIRLRQRVDAVSRYQNFETFSEKYISLTKRSYYNVEELQKYPPEADIYIAGSDQIWNTDFRNGTDAAFYLDFGPLRTKRISYAASFALSDLTYGSDEFVKEHLSKFDAISVRESSGLRILSSLGYNGFITVDPVFLLSAGEWDAMFSCQEIYDPYILVYDLMGCNLIKRLAKQLAKQYKCKIYSVSPRRFSYVDKNYPQVAPDQFVQFIRNARCVVSNSYHGTAFAIIYHRDFYVVDRIDGQNERMHDLLASLGLKSRLLEKRGDKVTLKDSISYDDIDVILRKKLEKTKAFLSKALQ